MNAFLAGLLDRAEGRAPVLERRQRALFEPRETGDSRLLEPLEQDETIVSGAPPAPRLSSTNAIDSGERGAARHSAERIEHSRNAPTLPTPRRQTWETVSAEPRDARVSSEAPQIRAHATRSENPPQPRQAARIDAVVERHESLVTVTKLVDARNGPERAASHRDPRTDDASRVPALQRDADARQTVNQTTVIVEHSRMIPAPTTRHMPRAAAESAVRHAQAQAPLAGRQDVGSPIAPAPVQITVGRVEVRAVSEKRERSPAKGPAAPRLSLDEYLRQRGGAPR